MKLSGFTLFHAYVYRHDRGEQWLNDTSGLTTFSQVANHANNYIAFFSKNVKPIF